MDSWKPLQLKMMELGGNQKLKDFFRKHNIADDMPIKQKYNTRAADWYRKNLRALAEGTESPAPLLEGSGCLPVDAIPSTMQVAASPPMVGGGLTSASIASDCGIASRVSGYHGGGSYHDGGSSGARSGVGITGDSGSAPSAPRDGDDFFTGVFGSEVGSKVSGGFWTALSATKKLADKAKKLAEDKVVQAQNEGWVDAVADTAKQGVNSAVDTTAWAAHRSVEAGKATYSYINEKGGQEVLNQTAEALEKTARTSVTAAGSGIEWFTEKVIPKPTGNEAALQGMSTGRMQGFGSDCLPPSSPQVDVDTLDSRLADTEKSFAALGSGVPSGSASSRGAATKKADIWNDEMWDDWN
jgi:ADP-ribosylation factor GTPase-activating protein 1